MIIMKFGGTSVSTSERLQTICDIVQKEKEKNPVIVVSAIRGVTDALLACLTASEKEREEYIKTIRHMHVTLFPKEWDDDMRSEVSAYIDTELAKLSVMLLIEERTPALSDHVVSFGEKLSSYLIAHILKSQNLPAQQIVATECIVTDNEFGAAEFKTTETKKATEKTLMPLIKKGIVPVVTGFIGRNLSGEITTLGRGGSDYSAAILGYALGAKEIQIWTDVDGIYTSDPRFIKDAHVLKNVSYREASELAAFGAKVLHPRTIRPAVKHGIAVRVCNTLHPDAPGTLIDAKGVSAKHVAAIAFKKQITVVDIYSTDMLFSKGFLAKVFTIFANHSISINIVSVSEVSISVSFDNDEHLADAIAELESFSEVTKTKAYGMVSIIGEEVVLVKDIMKEIFSLLAKMEIPIKMISLGATDINASIVVPTERVLEVAQTLHTELITKGKHK